MIPEYETRIAIRLSSKQREKIEELIDQGKYKNLSQVVRASLEEFLRSFKGEINLASK